MNYPSAAASFKLTDVDHIRGEDDKGEFFVVVVGTSQNKYFKVKTRMFKALFSRLLTGTVPNDGDPDQNNKSDPVPDRGYVATPVEVAVRQVGRA